MDSLESSFDSFFLFWLNGIWIIKGVIGIVCKHFLDFFWNVYSTIPNVNVPWEVVIKQVDYGLYWPMFKGHIIKDDSIIVWTKCFQDVNVGNEQRSFEMSQSITCFASIGWSPQEH